jgi:imidazolonepropionase-like amidohydrolase
MLGKGRKMNRREFLKYTALMAAAAASPSLISCDDIGYDGSAYYVKPQPLVRPEEMLLLTNGNVIDVVAGNVANGHILLQNGRILDVFDHSPEVVTADRRLDLKGAYVSPGLINAHCHITMPTTVSGIGRGLIRAIVRQGERNAEECIKHGVTTIRDMAALGAQVHQLRAKIADGTVVGPRIISSFVLDVPRGYLDSMIEGFGLLGDRRYYMRVQNPADGIEGVDRAGEAGAGLVKVSHQDEPFTNILPDPQHMDDEIMMAICNRARELELPVALHHTCTEGLRKGLKAGVNSFEHIACNEILTPTQIAELGKSWLIPTISVGYALSWQTDDDTAAEWDNGLKAQFVAARAKYMIDFAYDYAEQPIAEAIEQEYYNYCDPSFFSRPHFGLTVNMDATDTILDIGIENLLLCYNAGVKMGCGNDGGIPFDYPGAIGLEMNLLQMVGLAPMDILRMATLNNAEIIGMADQLGSIEPGKIGDLAIFANNPLENFENAYHPTMVFQDGVLAYRADF